MQPQSASGYRRRPADRKGELSLAVRYALSNWIALTRYRDDGRIEIGRVDDWRGNHALRGVAVGRRSRCLSPRRVSRFQSPLVEPDMQVSRIRLSHMRSRAFACITAARLDPPN
jgi:hypothetical protein